MAIDLSKLDALTLDVTQNAATERPGSSPLNAEKRAGVYLCAVCQSQLFSSETKYDSGSGWPSFYAPEVDAIGEKIDKKLFQTRVEVHCENCKAHMGHLFNDGPTPTGLRYCINGAALKFTPSEGE